MSGYAQVRNGECPTKGSEANSSWVSIFASKVMTLAWTASAIPHGQFCSNRKIRPPPQPDEKISAAGQKRTAPAWRLEDCHTAHANEKPGHEGRADR